MLLLLFLLLRSVGRSVGPLKGPLKVYHLSLLTTAYIGERCLSFPFLSAWAAKLCEYSPPPSPHHIFLFITHSIRNMTLLGTILPNALRLAAPTRTRLLLLQSVGRSVVVHIENYAFGWAFASSSGGCKQHQNVSPDYSYSCTVTYVGQNRKGDYSTRSPKDEN